MNQLYKICKLCGASLDPDEKCDCMAKREERTDDRPKPDTLHLQKKTDTHKCATSFNFIMENKKMEKLKGLDEAKTAIIRYKIYRMNCKDEGLGKEFDHLKRFYDVFDEEFKNMPEEQKTKEWLFFTGFIAGIEDEERINNGKR